MRKENRNPNRLLPSSKVKEAQSGSHSHTPEAVSTRQPFKPRFIKKSIHISEALPSSQHSLQLASDASETYLHSPASITEHNTLDIGQVVGNRLRWKDSCTKIQEELDSRTQQFNASILYFQRILTDMQKIANDSSIPTKERLAITSQRIEQLVNVFEEFSLGHS